MQRSEWICCRKSAWLNERSELIWQREQSKCKFDCEEINYNNIFHNTWIMYVQKNCELIFFFTLKR